MNHLSSRGAASRPGSAGARRARQLLALATTAALAVSLAACAGDPAQEDPDQDIAVVWASSNIATNLDPAIGLDANNLAFYRNVYEGLTEYAPGSTEVRPALAESWDISEDGRTYTFHLREGVTFHDGTEFTADAVVKSFDRMAEIGQGPARFLKPIESWTAIDDATVEITLIDPYSFFLGNLPWLPIISPAALDEHAGSDLAQEWLSTHAVGTGPYQLDNFEINNRVDLVAYEDYWQEWQPGTPTSVTMTLVTDSATRQQLLQQGQTQFVGSGFSPADFTALSQLPNIETIVQPGLALRTIALNTQAGGPMADPNFREALIAAFPYQDYVKYYEGWGDPTNGPIPPGMTGYDASLPVFEQDLDRAEELFTDGGYVNAGVTLDMITVEGASFGQYAGTLLQDALAQFGITLNVQALPWPQIPPLMADPATAFDLGFLNMSANTPDPTGMLETSFASYNVAANGGYNWSNIVDPKIDQLIVEARGASSEEAAGAAVAELTERALSYHSVIYAIAPQMVNPVAEGWGNAKYDALFNLITVRFFYAQKSN